jgi:hypothetical protein
MNRLLKLIPLCALLVLLGAPSQAKERSFTARAKSGSAKDKAKARTEVSKSAVQIVLKEEGLLGKIQGKARDALIADCVSLLVRERFRERRGSFRYSAKIDLELVRQKVLAAKGDKGKTAAVKGLKFVTDVQLVGKYGKRTEALKGVAEAALASRLQKSGHKVVGVNAKKAPKGALVVSVRLGVKFETFKAGEPASHVFSGRYRMQGTTVRVYDPATDAVRMSATIRSDKRKPRFADSDEKALAEPRVPKNDPADQVQERYVEHAADWVGRLIVKKLNSESASAGKAASKLVHYTGRFKGLSAKEFKEVFSLLKENKALKGLKDVGQVGVFHMLKFASSVEGKKVLEEALKEAGVKAKITVSGVYLNVLKRK